MNNNMFLHLIGAAGTERLLIERLVRDLGIRTFLENADSIVLSNKTKNSIEWLNNILYGKGNSIEGVAGLTEIPVKLLKQYKQKDWSITEYVSHPEKLDIDARQFHKLLCLKEVIMNFQDDRQEEYIPIQDYQQEI
jgi:hypothetical protein